MYVNGVRRGSADRVGTECVCVCCFPAEAACLHTITTTTVTTWLFAFLTLSYIYCSLSLSTLPGRRPPASRYRARAFFAQQPAVSQPPPLLETIAASLAQIYQFNGARLVRVYIVRAQRAVLKCCTCVRLISESPPNPFIKR